jgi:hypothetical protein
VGAAPGLSHRRPAKRAVFLAFPSGIPYATGLRHLIPGGNVMKKQSGKGNRSGKRVVRDLPPSDAATPGVKGGVLGSAISEVMKNFGGALNTAARGG